MQILGMKDPPWADLQIDKSLENIHFFFANLQTDLQIGNLKSYFIKHPMKDFSSDMFKI